MGRGVSPLGPYPVPMSENYPLFKPYLKPALEIIEQKLSG